MVSARFPILTILVPSVPAWLHVRHSRSSARCLGEGREDHADLWAYLINGDNRVTSYKPVEADTDADAMKAARQFVDGCDVEVWHLDRKIGRLERPKKQ